MDVHLPLCSCYLCQHLSLDIKDYFLGGVRFSFFYQHRMYFTLEEYDLKIYDIYTGVVSGTVWRWG